MRTKNYYRVRSIVRALVYGLIYLTIVAIMTVVMLGVLHFYIQPLIP